MPNRCRLTHTVVVWFPVSPTIRTVEALEIRLFINLWISKLGDFGLCANVWFRIKLWGVGYICALALFLCRKLWDVIIYILNGKKEPEKRRTRLFQLATCLRESLCNADVYLFSLIIQTPSKQVSDCSTSLASQLGPCFPYFISGSLPHFIHNQFQLHNNISLNSVLMRPAPFMPTLCNWRL